MDIEKILSEMTLEEKASLLNGLDFWHLKGVERLGIPSVMVTDGPHGLRKQSGASDHLGLYAAVPATAFPTAAVLACSFDRELAGEVGDALGALCAEEDVSVILGPGANIKRSPLCGRNFEYFSEDPYLTGEMAAAHIRGVQGRSVGTSLKHFALNNQETRRMSVSVDCSERAMREIYLTGFEKAVKQGRPWTVMCSYNKIGGVYSSENGRLLNDILRGEWGFDGYTMTDWGACCDHVKGVANGMSLAMPALGDAADAEIVDAVRAGRLSEEAVTRAAGEILTVMDRYLTGAKKDPDFELGVQHHLARRVARECAVLLKNDDNTLPLKSSGAIAFIGAFAETPRYQGGGSSHINASELTSALQAVRSVAKVEYAKGFEAESDSVDEALMREAVALAARSDTAVIFAGLPESYESEGFDRKHMRMPENQNRLIREVAAVCPRTVVVLHNGSAIELPWIDDVQAVLEMYLGGQAVGGAAVDLLFGAVSPSGKLAETFPLRLQDNPSYLTFPGNGDTVHYTEGIYVGYRWYDSRDMAVRFPFGYGLSYTTFEYSDLRVSADTLTPGGCVTVSVDITNTGRFGAKEIAQLYISSAHNGIDRPAQELKGFEKVYIAPRKTETVTFTVSPRDLAYWSEVTHDWYTENGAYELRIGASSRDIRLTATLTFEGSPALPVRVTADTVFADIVRIPGWEQVVGKELDMLYAAFGSDSDAAEDDINAAVIRFLPLHAAGSFMPQLGLDAAWVDSVVNRLNALQEG